MTHLASADCDPEFTRLQVERFRGAHRARSRHPDAPRSQQRRGAPLPGGPLRRGPLRRRALRALAVRRGSGRRRPRAGARLAQLARPGEAARRRASPPATDGGSSRAADLDRHRPGRLRGRLPPGPDGDRGARRRRAPAGRRHGLDGRDRRRASAASCPSGTPVTLVGDGLLLEEHARVAGTINYELACGIGSAARARPARRGGCSMRELARELLGARGGLGRRRGRPRRAARPARGRPRHRVRATRCEPRRAYARRSGGAPFPLSERHGAWRVALDEGRTVDFTPLRGTIEDDLATRDFTINAIAVPLSGGDAVDPFGGRARPRGAEPPARFARASSTTIRCGCCGRSASWISSGSARRGDDRADPRQRRTWSRRRPASGFSPSWSSCPPTVSGARRAGPAAHRSAARSTDSRDDGLAQRSGCRGSSARTSSATRSRTTSGGCCGRFCARSGPTDDSPREIHRFRRATEPWALEALEFLGATGACEPRSRRRAAASRPSRCCAATSSAFRPDRRSAACSSGSRRSAPRARSRRARTRSSSCAASERASP